MRTIRTLLAVLAVFLAAVCAPNPLIAADDWLPVPPEDLAMKDYPASPGAHAVMLYRQVRTDDVQSVESHYYRIKILTEEGKKHANIELLYLKGDRKIQDIKARTIRPDGTILNFDGQIFEKTVVKARGFKFQAKTFSIPDAQVGSIIEYRYDERWSDRELNSPAWFLQTDLPTRKAVFSFKPYQNMVVAWTSARLPNGVDPKEGKGRVIEMTVENLAAFQEEEMSPPVNELKSWVQFYYFRRNPESSDKFWENIGKIYYDYIEAYIGKRKGIQEEVARITLPTDPPEEKLRKIYARVQQIRNLSYERSKTEKEEKREKLKDNNNVEDVLKNGYGWRSQINSLFVAMARAAGFEATVVIVSERDVQFFQKHLLNTRQLDGEVTAVMLGQNEHYFDPGTLDCPFGMLRWLRSGVTGIRLAKDGGSKFVTTPQPVSDDARVVRRAKLQLNEEGALSGTLEVRFIGQEALTRRYSTLEEDDAGRVKEIEDEIKGWLPNGATVKIENITGWTGFAEPLRVQASIEVPGFASSAGRRILLPTNVLTVNEKHPFNHMKRTHPVYLRNPYQEDDEVTVTLPAGYKVESVPAPRTSKPPYGTFQIQRAADGATIKHTRHLTLNGFYFPIEYYASLRTFFNNVRAGDEEQVVLQVASSASN